jgi:hypothetical protein
MPAANPVLLALEERRLRERGIEVPRSWPHAEKLLFLQLPEPIQAIIARREKQRETEMRRAQSELATLKQKLKGYDNGKEHRRNTEAHATAGSAR